MIFLVVVVVSATRAGLVVSLYSAVLCALAFDYFFLPPFQTFILAGPQEWVSMFTFAISSLVAGRVAERARKQKDEAEHRREDVERLFQISQEMILHQDTASLIRDLPHLLCRPYPLGIVKAKLTSRLLWPGQSLSTGEEATAARDGFSIGDKIRFVVFTGAGRAQPSQIATNQFVIDEHRTNDVPLRVKH